MESIITTPIVGIDNGDITQAARLAVTGLNIDTLKDKSLRDEIMISKSSGFIYYRLKDGNIISIDQANRIDICTTKISQWLKDNLFTNYDIYYHDIEPFKSGIGDYILFDNVNILLNKDFKYFRIFIDMINPSYTRERIQPSFLINRNDSELYVGGMLNVDGETQLVELDFSEIISRENLETEFGKSFNEINILGIENMCMQSSFVNDNTFVLGIYVAYIK